MFRQLLSPIATLTFFFLALFIYTKLIGPLPLSINSVNTTKSDLFTVTGEGEVNIKPDIVIIRVGVQSSGNTVSNAQERLNIDINAVSDSIKQLNVADEDIQTENYNIYPNYDNTNPQRIVNYTANSNLVIKVRDLDKANNILDTAISNGANQVGSISFEVDDKSEAENEARKEAVAKAKMKASLASQIAGFKLGRIINYSESFEGFPIPMPLQERSLIKEDVATQIEHGSNEVKVSVTLSYEII